MEKFVKFEPAYDKRNSDPNKNYGIHGVNIRFILKGEHGAVQFLLYTNWQLPHVKKEHIANKVGKPMDKYELEAYFYPMATDLGYHSKVKFYDGQYESEDCEYTGGKCYYDGSGLAAEDVFEKLLSGGDTAVWKEMEDYYVYKFGELT